MNRRSFLRAATAVSTGAALPGTATAATGAEPDVRVNVYATTGVGGNTEDINALARRLQQALEAVGPGLTVRVGPEGLVDVPDGEAATAKGAWCWWRRHGPTNTADANLLVFPYRAWPDRGGWAGVGPARNHGVCSGAAFMDRPRFQHVAIHEVGHNLGLRHDHAGGDPGALMTHDVPDRPSLSFSRRSIRSLTRVYGR